MGRGQILKDTYDLSLGRWGHASGQVGKRGRGQKPRRADLISAREPESAREKRMVTATEDVWPDGHGWLW